MCWAQLPMRCHSDLFQLVMNFLNDACAYFDQMTKWQPAKENAIATYDNPTQQRPAAALLFYNVNPGTLLSG